MTTPELRVFLNAWMCGCGQPEEAVRFLRDVLQTYAERRKATDILDLGIFDQGSPTRQQAWERHAEALAALLPSPGIRFFVLYILSDWGLLEHGGSVDGSWLTDKGGGVLEALNHEREDSFEKLCEASCIHGYAMDEECPLCQAGEP